MLESKAYALLLLLLGCVATCVPKVHFVQPITTSKTRELRVPSTADQPPFSVRISAEGQKGAVAVRDEKGTEVQKLVCPLLRDNVEVTQEELAAVREQFVSQFVIDDLDFDGHVDLAGVREFGAKWARYCVWLYDSRQHMYVRDFLAEQMELLTNLKPLGDRQISSSHMGPANSWIAVYRVVEADDSWPVRQLVPLRSCWLEPGLNGAIQVMAQFEGRQTVMRRKDVAEKDVSSALDKCAAGAP